MNRQRNQADAILWAAAIIASALLGAPHFLCLIVLPTLAVLSLRKERQTTCFNRSDLS